MKVFGCETACRLHKVCILTRMRQVPTPTLALRRGVYMIRRIAVGGSPAKVRVPRTMAN